MSDKDTSSEAPVEPEDGDEEAQTEEAPEERLLPEVGCWAAAQSNARAEKKVAAYLEMLQVPYFLPMRVNRRTYGARVRESLIPLFPGYLFYDVQAIDKSRLFACRRITRVLVPDQPAELETDLLQIARALKVEPALKRCEEIPPGTPVKVIDGPFMGLEGIMVRRDRGFSVVIQVHFTGFGAEVSVEEHCLERIEDASAA